MKTLLLSLTFCVVFCAGSFAQTINGIPLDSLNAKYIRASFSGTGLNKVHIFIDYGQRRDLSFSAREYQLRGDDGKRLILNSVIDALNFLNGYGYELVEIYGLENDQFILRKKVELQQFSDGM